MSRTGKRVFAGRRGPDGSAFEKCESCGFSVAIALADMHECQPVKKCKGYYCQINGNLNDQKFKDQPRSAFRFFMEEFMKACDDEDEDEIEMDRKGFETWKNMSKEERRPYVLQEEKVDLAYNNILLKEENDFDSWVDDEADSAEVGKYDKIYEGFQFFVESENSDSYDIFWSESSESLNRKLLVSIPRI